MIRLTLAFAFFSLIAPLALPQASGNEVTIEVGKGTSLAGRSSLQKRADGQRSPVVIYLAGGEDLSEGMLFEKYAKERSWSLLSIQLRPTEIDELAQSAAVLRSDLSSILAFAKGMQGVDPERIAVVGTSYGAELACMAAADHSARGAVAFGASRGRLRTLGWEDETGLRGTLFVAGEKQSIEVPMEARALSLLAAEPSRPLVVPDSDQGGMDLAQADSNLLNQIVPFLGGVLEGDRFETVELEAEDGLKVTADVYDVHPAGAPWIVLCHQASFSRGEYRETAPHFVSLGFNAIALDQRSGNEAAGIANRTAARAADKGLDSEFTDAIPDLLAGLAWANERAGEAPVVLVGSSYSASLALIVAAEHPELVDGVLSFSPGEYLRDKGTRFVQESAALVQCPVMIASPGREAARWSEIFEALPGAEKKRKWRAIPQSRGQHGSRTLWAEFKDSSTRWIAVERYLVHFTPGGQFAGN